MSELPEVRIAQPSDEEEVIAMCRRLHEENGLFSFSESKVRACLERCFSGKGNIVGVIGPPGTIEASTCLALSDYYYTTDWHVAELWNYVLPEYRRSRNAEALIEYGKDCALKLKMPLLTGVITNQNMIEKVRLYRRRLGAATGAFFVWNPPEHWQRPAEVPPDDLSDLRRRISEMMKTMQSRNMNGLSRMAMRQQVLPLLREVYDLVRQCERERGDEFWAAADTHAAHHVNGAT